jgi:hypothetical protein
MNYHAVSYPWSFTFSFAQWPAHLFDRTLASQDKPWSGPIDHELMGFNSIVKALQRSLRNLTEILTAHAVITHKARLSPEDYINTSFRYKTAQPSSL